MWIVSACLLGIACRYDGGSARFEAVVQWSKNKKIIPVCPEQLGGLPTPRFPAERVGNLVMTGDGRDVTEAYIHGARQLLHLADLYGCRGAVLKRWSPACSPDGIYNGAFTSTKIPGMGIAAEMLLSRGIAMYSEENLPE